MGYIADGYGFFEGGNIARREREAELTQDESIAEFERLRGHNNDATHRKAVRLQERRPGLGYADAARAVNRFALSGDVPPRVPRPGVERGIGAPTDSGDSDALDALGEHQQGAGATQFEDAVDTDLSELQCGAPAENGDQHCGGSLTTTDDPNKARCLRCGALNDLSDSLAEPPDDGMSMTEVVDCPGCARIFRLRDNSLANRCPNCKFLWSYRDLRSAKQRALTEHVERSAQRLGGRPTY